MHFSQYRIQVTARPSLKPFHEFKYGSADGSQRGIILSSGNEWLEQRKFCLRKLKDLGMGQRSKIDILISNEAAKLCTLLKQEIEGKFWSLSHYHNLINRLKTRLSCLILNSSRCYNHDYAG